MSILFDLQNARNFTESDRTIARYILDNSELIADMSVSDLARASHTSNASVVRLCQKVGSKGFRDFQMALLRELSKVPEDAVQTDVNFPVYDRSSPVIVMKNMADVHKYAVNACFTSISALDVQKAAFLIHKSQHVFLYGIGESKLVAEMLARRLMRIGYITVVVEPTDEHYAVTMTAHEGDTAVMISYSGAGLQAYEDDISLFRQKKMHTILITSNKNIHSFECNICYPAMESPQKNAATFYSTEAAMYISDSIYSLLFAMDYKDIKEEKMKVDRTVRRKSKI